MGSQLESIANLQFAKAIEKATTYLSGSSLKTSSNTKGKFLSYRTNGEIGQLSLSEIIYIESLGNYLKLFSVKQNLPIIVYGSLSSVISQLDSFDFVQVHRFYVINRNKMFSVNPKTVMMSNWDILPVGRKYKIMLDSYR